MTQVLLCAGPGLLVVKKDGLLFFRRPGQPDAPVPYAPKYYSVFLDSARRKHGLLRILGPSAEEAPCLPDDVTIPALRRDQLASGEEVYRLESVEPEWDTQIEQDERAGRLDAQAERARAEHRAGRTRPILSITFLEGRPDAAQDPRTDLRP